VSWFLKLFKPVRIILRITWDLAKACGEYSMEKASIVEVGEENIEEACRVFVDGMQPYWNWLIEEEGGRELVLQRAREWIKHSDALNKAKQLGY